jgi:hypothetical protein
MSLAQSASARRNDADGVSVHHDRELTAGEKAGVGPAGQLQGLGLGRTLAVGQARVEIAAVGAHETIDHGLERAGHLVPIDRRHQ